MGYKGRELFDVDGESPEALGASDSSIRDLERLAGQSVNQKEAPGAPGSELHKSLTELAEGVSESPRETVEFIRRNNR